MLVCDPGGAPPEPARYARPIREPVRAEHTGEARFLIRNHSQMEGQGEAEGIDCKREGAEAHCQADQNAQYGQKPRVARDSVEANRDEMLRRCPWGESAMAGDMEVADAPEQQARAGDHDWEGGHAETGVARQEQPGYAEREVAGRARKAKRARQNGPGVCVKQSPWAAYGLINGRTTTVSTSSSSRATPAMKSSPIWRMRMGGTETGPR